MNYQNCVAILLASICAAVQADIPKEKPLVNGRINELFIGPDGLTLDVTAIGGCEGGRYQADLNVLTDSDLNRLLTTLLHANAQQRVVRLFHNQGGCKQKQFDRVSVTPY
jgi:hypothetical protein